MLHGFIEKFWPLLCAEAINVANIIRNCLISNRSTEDKTSFELIFGLIRSSSGIKIFGSKIYAHIIEENGAENRGDRAEEGIPVGFELEYIYRVFNPGIFTVKISPVLEIDESVYSPLTNISADPLNKFELAATQGEYTLENESNENIENMVENIEQLEDAPLRKDRKKLKFQH